MQFGVSLGIKMDPMELYAQSVAKVHTKLFVSIGLIAPKVKITMGSMNLIAVLMEQ
jgi:hypothetical protein